MNPMIDLASFSPCHHCIANEAVIHAHRFDPDDGTIPVEFDGVLFKVSEVRLHEHCNRPFPRIQDDVPHRADVSVVLEGDHRAVFSAETVRILVSEKPYLRFSIQADLNKTTLLIGQTPGKFEYKPLGNIGYFFSGRKFPDSSNVSYGGRLVLSWPQREIFELSVKKLLKGLVSVSDAFQRFTEAEAIAVREWAERDRQRALAISE